MLRSLSRRYQVLLFLPHIFGLSWWPIVQLNLQNVKLEIREGTINSQVIETQTKSINSGDLLKFEFDGIQFTGSYYLVFEIDVGLTEKIYYGKEINEFNKISISSQFEAEFKSPFQTIEGETNRENIYQKLSSMLENAKNSVTLVTSAEGLGRKHNVLKKSLKKLKEGFKQIYGDSVFSFLFNYKMEFARKLLETNTVNVNEVGLKVGYSTSSHFIAAFKKKFGITPKKYVQSLNQEQ